MSDSIVRWGIISSAKIARTALMPAIAAAPNAKLVALGTPRPERIAESASEYGYRVLPSYEAVLADREVDAIYIPLPNGLHASWTIKALMAGKHVLCEKPFSVTPGESAEMLKEAKKHGLWLMEAFMYRFHPQMPLAKSVLDSGRIGTLRLIRASFSFNSTPDPTNPRFQADQGPGALMDVGCYCVNAIRCFSDGPPVAVSAWETFVPEWQGDMTTTGVLEYPTHTGLFDCSFESFFRTGIEIVGDKGTIEIPKPWLPGKDPAIVRVSDDNGVEELTTEGVDQYALMVEHFSDCILNNHPPVRGPEDAMENMLTLTAIQKSAREKQRVLLSEL